LRHTSREQDALRFCPVRPSAGAAPSGAAGAAAVAAFECTSAVGARQLRRKRSAGGGSVPESTGAATDDAAEVVFARMASLAAVAINVAFPRPSLCSSDFPHLQSASVVREENVHPNGSHLKSADAREYSTTRNTLGLFKSRKPGATFRSWSLHVASFVAVLGPLKFANLRNGDAFRAPRPST
jgi:hypothetical protein